jgi:hypothetical protein
MSTSQKKEAGRLSGVRRTKRADVRRFFVLDAFERLPAIHRIQPFSDKTIDALEQEFRNPSRPNRTPSAKLSALLDKAVSAACEPALDLSSLYNISRDTLISDLKFLGVKSKSRQ